MECKTCKKQFDDLDKLTVNKLPKCRVCGEEIQEKEMLYWCKENPLQFHHTQCFTTDHPKKYDGLVHNDVYGQLILSKD